MALSAIMVISAAVTYNLTFNNSGTVTEQGAITVAYNGNTYNNSDSVSIDWGNIAPGQTYTKAVTIHNDVNAPITPGITSTLSSTYGTITLSSTTPIAANSEATVNVVLTVSSTALAGVIPAWTATFTASS